MKEKLNQTIICKYNPKHKVNIDNIESHYKICPDKHLIDINKLPTTLSKENIVICPFNKSHHLEKDNLNKHLKVCISKPRNSEIQKEIGEFLINNKNQMKEEERKTNEKTNLKDEIKFNKQNEKNSKRINKYVDDINDIVNKENIDEYNNDNSGNINQINLIDEKYNNFILIDKENESIRSYHDEADELEVYDPNKDLF